MKTEQTQVSGKWKMDFLNKNVKQENSVTYLYISIRNNFNRGQEFH